MPGSLLPAAVGKIESRRVVAFDTVKEIFRSSHAATDRQNFILTGSNEIFEPKGRICMSLFECGNGPDRKGRRTTGDEHNFA